MMERPPPSWGDDELTKFFDLARGNQYASFVRKKNWYSRLSSIDALFFKVAQNIINPKENEIVASTLFYRSHSAFRTTCMLSMASQPSESFVQIRSCLEYAAYALHMSMHSGHDVIWLNRNDSDKDKAAMLSAFAMAKVRASIGQRDKGLLKVFDQLYERSIDFGGHPNLRGVTGSMQIDQQADRTLITQAYLQGDGLALDHSLKSNAQAGICALRLFQFMMTAKFELLGVRAGIEEVQRGL